jgi:uncharacterized protein YjbI with pentapeptide repeats
MRLDKPVVRFMKKQFNVWMGQNKGGFFKNTNLQHHHTPSPGASYPVVCFCRSQLIFVLIHTAMKKYYDSRHRTADLIDPARIYRKMIENPIITSLVIVSLILVVVIIMSWPYYFYDTDNFIEQILAEMHGLVFDVLILGILFVWLDRQRTESNRKKQHLEDIEDLRHWRNPEASHRAIANLRRLNRINIYAINLNEYYMNDMKLARLNLRGSDMNFMEAKNMQIYSCDLRKTTMSHSDFSYLNMRDVMLEDAYMAGSNAQASKWYKITAARINLTSVNLENATFNQVDFSGAIFINARLKGAKLINVNLRWTQGLTIETLESCILDNVVMDDDIHQELIRRQERRNRVPQTAMPA